MEAKSRISNIGAWTLAILGFPFAYICLPFSCCIRNPAAKIFSEESPDNKVGENLAVGCIGAYACITCGCCCCGQFGKYGPNDV